MNDTKVMDSIKAKYDSYMELIQNLFQEVINSIRSYDRSSDLSMIFKSFYFAEERHRYQFRKSGDPFIIHCLETAKILASWRLDLTTVACGFLHDLVEDGRASSEELEKLFGKDIASIVDGVTKIKKMHFSRIANQAENLRKMIIAVSKDLRVILVRLADRLHNMRTLQYLEVESQISNANETLELYAQIAHRLGMSKVSSELSELSLKYVDPQAYEEISRLVENEIRERGKYIDELYEGIKEILKSCNIKAVVNSRRKDIYSIYQKMKKREIQFENIYDLFAFRVIVGSPEEDEEYNPENGEYDISKDYKELESDKFVSDCYVVLGAIHSKWTPIPGRIKDYIAMPKSNGYRSLHTTVIGPLGKPVEIQIRTYKMHKRAEEGIAAHWRYKTEGLAPTDSWQFSWLRRILEDIQEFEDPKQLIESVRTDLFADEVYVFTPKGDVKVLPKGSTPIDFAYSIHTEIGDQCVGAKVNDISVPLKYELKNGDRVEILTRPGAHPSRDWIKYVKTSRAKSKIRQWIRQQERAESIKVGQELLKSELHARQLSGKVLLKSDELLEVAKKLNLLSVEDLFAHIGYGKITAKHIVNLLAPETAEKEERTAEHERSKKQQPSGGIRVGGIDHPFVRFAKCCRPIPGDDVVGFVTRGRGVTIHLSNCKEISGETERILKAEWDTKQDELYPVQIAIESDDKKGMLAELASVIANNGINISNVNVKTNNQQAKSFFTLEVSNLEQLQKVMKSLSNIKGVRRVVRRP